MNKRLLPALSGALLAVSAAAYAAPTTKAVEPYAYGSPAFTMLVSDSYRQITAAAPQTF